VAGGTGMVKSVCGVLGTSDWAMDHDVHVIPDNFISTLKMIDG